MSLSSEQRDQDCPVLDDEQIQEISYEIARRLLMNTNINPLIKEEILKIRPDGYSPYDVKWVNAMTKQVFEVMLIAARDFIYED